MGRGIFFCTVIENFTKALLLTALKLCTCKPVQNCGQWVWNFSSSKTCPTFCNSTRTQLLQNVHVHVHNYMSYPTHHSFIHVHNFSTSRAIKDTGWKKRCACVCKKGLTYLLNYYMLCNGACCMCIFPAA